MPINKEHQRAYNKAWYAANKEHCAAYAKVQHAANKERDRANAKAWKAAHPERVRAHNKAYHKTRTAAQLERSRATSKAWNAANRERHRATSKAWAAANKERRRARRDANPERARARALSYEKVYHAAHPERSSIDHTRRRARLAEVLSTLTVQEWKAILDAAGHACIYCGSGERLAMDHLTPISRGGPHTAENVAPACKPCNSSKGTKTVLEFLAEKARR